MKSCQRQTTGIIRFHFTPSVHLMRTLFEVINEHVPEAINN